MKKIMKKRKLPIWYRRGEIWGSILLSIFSTVSVIMMMFPEVEILYRIGGIIGVLIGLIKTMYGLTKGYKSDNLSRSITILMDKLPDNVTGKKGVLLK